MPPFIHSARIAWTLSRKFASPVVLGLSGVGHGLIIL